MCETLISCLSALVNNWNHSEYQNHKNDNRGHANDYQFNSSFVWTIMMITRIWTIRVNFFPIVIWNNSAIGCSSWCNRLILLLKSKTCLLADSKVYCICIKMIFLWRSSIKRNIISIEKYLAHKNGLLISIWVFHNGYVACVWVSELFTLLEQTKCGKTCLSFISINIIQRYNQSMISTSWIKVKARVVKLTVTRNYVTCQVLIWILYEWAVERPFILRKVDKWHHWVKCNYCSRR